MWRRRGRGRKGGEGEEVGNTGVGGCLILGPSKNGEEGLALGCGGSVHYRILMIAEPFLSSVAIDSLVPVFQKRSFTNFNSVCSLMMFKHRFGSCEHHRKLLQNMPLQKEAGNCIHLTSGFMPRSCFTHTECVVNVLSVYRHNVSSLFHNRCLSQLSLLTFKLLFFLQEHVYIYVAEW